MALASPRMIPRQSYSAGAALTTGRRLGYDEGVSRGDGGRGRFMHLRRLVIGVAVGLLALVAGSARGSDAPPEAADEATLKAARLGSDGPALLAYFRQRTVGEADRARIVAL